MPIKAPQIFFSKNITQIDFERGVGKRGGGWLVVNSNWKKNFRSIIYNWKLGFLGLQSLFTGIHTVNVL